MIRDRFIDLAVKKKLPRERARAMNPLLDFEQRYSNTEWTAGQFSAAVYAEVTRAR